MIADIYIGIDNGLTGGVAAIYGSTGEIRKLSGIPVKSGEVDSSMLSKCLECMAPNHHESCVVGIEECPKHAGSTTALRSMGISYGKIRATVELALPHAKIVTVRSGNPLDSWQRAILGKVPQGGTKGAAFAKARNIWPDQVWPNKWPRGTVPHDGIIDAALIAYHIRNLDLQKTNQ